MPGYLSILLMLMPNHQCADACLLAWLPTFSLSLANARLRATILRTIPCTHTPNHCRGHHALLMLPGHCMLIQSSAHFLAVHVCLRCLPASAVRDMDAIKSIFTTGAWKKGWRGMRGEMFSRRAHGSTTDLQAAAGLATIPEVRWRGLIGARAHGYVSFNMVSKGHCDMCIMYMQFMAHGCRA